MTFQHPHFLCHTSDAKSIEATFTASLIESLGQTPRDKADVIVTVGGDGLLMKTMAEAGGLPVYGLTPPGSNSRGFWTEHDVRDGTSLMQHLEQAETVLLKPLDAAITFTNGNLRHVYAFNDVSIERSTAQATIMNITAEFSKVSAGPFRIMGDGFVFSTALGSTGTNRSYHGPVVDIHNDVIITTGKGICQPTGIMAPLVALGDSVFSIAFASVATKRPVRIDCDGMSVSQDADGSRVSGLTVSLSAEKAVRMLTTKGPGLRAFLAMMPSGQ